MRYPVNFIPGLPVVPDVGIGITLTPVAPSAPAAAPASAGAVASPSLVWANVATATPANTDPLALQAPYGAGWETILSNQLFYGFGLADGEALALAIVENVPGGSLVTWSVDSVAVTGVTDIGVSPSVALYQAMPGITILYGDPSGSCYVFRFGDHDSFVGVAVSDITITAYVDGSPVGSLSLSVTAV